MEVWEAITESLHNPRRLVHKFQDLSGPNLISFWRACTGFEELNLTGGNAGGNVECFKLCPNLTKLDWTILAMENENRIRPFVEALKQTTWPRLENLSLSRVKEPDEVVATIIGHLPALRLDVDVDRKWAVSQAMVEQLKQGGSLQWRLKCGMGLLSTLRELRSVKFQNTVQNMDEEDLKWVFENLPRLEELMGRLSDDLPVGWTCDAW
ncbi:hypothetical protein BGX33_005669 [Mortierella sp. NVP41]|nr:hypothetical protein BGX33_005669 [Mortierella sp. NVP41]